VQHALKIKLSYFIILLGTQYVYSELHNILPPRPRCVIFYLIRPFDYKKQKKKWSFWSCM